HARAPKGLTGSVPGQQFATLAEHPHAGSPVDHRYGRGTEDPAGRLALPEQGSGAAVDRTDPIRWWFVVVEARAHHDVERAVSVQVEQRRRRPDHGALDVVAPLQRTVEIEGPHVS